MRRYLLLDSSYYPNKFNNVLNIVPGTTHPGPTVVSVVENSIVSSINSYNKRLAIDCVAYGNIGAIFPNVFSGAYSGVIVEECEIDPNDVDDKTNAGFYVHGSNGHYYASSVFGYVFLSPPTETSRNIHVSQSVFPELLDYIGKYFSSPSYTTSNKPNYYINIVNSPITAPMILKHFVGLDYLDVQYIGVFYNTFQTLNIPVKIEDYLNTHYLGDMQIIGSDTCFLNHYFETNISKKEFKIKTTDFVVGSQLVLNGGFVSVNGSYEKFYLIEMLPAAIFAIRSGYKMDISDFQTLCRNNGTHQFRPNNEKLRRLRFVLNYLEKLINCRR